MYAVLKSMLRGILYYLLGYGSSGIAVIVVGRVVKTEMGGLILLAF